MKGKKKILFALGILVAAAVYYYVTLPAINIHSSDTWVMGLFLLLVLAAAYVVKKRLGRHSDTGYRGSVSDWFCSVLTDCECKEIPEADEGGRGQFRRRCGGAFF